MPKFVGSFERGKVDIVNIAAIGFLALSLVAVISVVSNPQVKQIFAPKAIDTEYPTSGYDKDTIINLNAELNRAGYDCNNGGCPPGVEVSGYYQSNGRWYAIGGTGNDPSKYSGTSLAAKKAADAKAEAEVNEIQKRAAEEKAAYDKYISEKAANEMAAKTKAETDKAAVNEIQKRAAEEKAVVDLAAKVKADKEAVIKREQEAAIAASLAKQSTIEVNSKGGVSMKNQIGGECEFNSDCGSGSCSQGTCKTTAVTEQSIIPDNYKKILNEVSPSTNTTTNTLLNENSILTNTFSNPSFTPTAQTPNTPASVGNNSIFGQLLDSISSISQYVQKVIQGNQNLATNTQLTDAQSNGFIDAPFPTLPANLATTKQTAIQMSTPTTNTNSLFFNSLTSNSLLSDNGFSNIAKTAIEKSNNQPNQTIKKIGGDSLETTANLLSDTNNNRTYIAPTPISFNLPDWIASTTSNIIAFFQRKPTTTDNSPISDTSNNKVTEMTSLPAENIIDLPITKPIQQQTQTISEQPAQTIQQQTPSKTKVMVIGDSITKNYLLPTLSDQLKTKGYNVEFVGGNESRGGILSEGHGGYNTQAIVNSLKAGKWYYQLDTYTTPPVAFNKGTDVVVLELGVNDIGSGNNSDTVTIPNMKYIIDYLRKNVNPNVKVVITPVPNIYFQDKDYYQEAKYLNNRLTEMTSQISTSDSPVIMGSSYAEQYILSQNTLSDGVHPNSAGAEKIAGSIVNAIDNNNVITKQEEIPISQNTNTTSQNTNTTTASSTSQTFYNQSSPEWQNYKITANVKDSSGNVIGQVTKTMGQIGCGPTTVANILSENGTKITPTQVAQEIPANYWVSGGTSFQANIDVLKQKGYKADPYTKSLYNLTKYVDTGELVWISSRVGGNTKDLEHYSYIDGYTIENGTPVYSMRDPYFGSDLKCTATSGSSLGCNGSNGHFTYNTANQAVIILTPPST
jgi:lysophospholipase L1-like esterase